MRLWSTNLSCVAAQCDTSADCASPDAPVCINKLCVAKCETDTDCLGAAAAPFCASDGKCVGCTMASQCGSDKPFCDATEQTCRGCLEDSECSSGVCVEATAACADAGSIVYVSSVGTNIGTCPKATPCASIGYAMDHLVGAAPVIRVSGSTLLNAETISLDKSVAIDSDGTTISKPSSAAAFVLVGGNNNESGVIIEGIVLACGGTGPAVTVSNAGQLRLHHDTFQQCQIETTGATLGIEDATFAAGTVTCTSGTLTFGRSSFAGTSGGIVSMNCQAAITQSRFQPASDSTIDANGGLVTVENNLFVVPSEFTDLMRVRSTTAGSTIAFNTIVNTSSVMQSPKAIICDATQKVTSNIIAYNSGTPIAPGSGCVVTSSVFDLAAGTVMPGNQSVDVATIFKDRGAMDFHLSATSPALAGGEAGIVTVDLESASRPQPIGSKPDIGAYEAP